MLAGGKFPKLEVFTPGPGMPAVGSSWVGPYKKMDIDPDYNLSVEDVFTNFSASTLPNQSKLSRSRHLVAWQLGRERR